jgi:enoyl-CoA hydratase
LSYETLSVEREGAVAVVTVSRPEKLNALNAVVRRELLDAFDEIGTDDRVRVVVLTGAGEKAFVAGADVSEFAERSPMEQRATMKGRRIFEVVAEFPKPTIAMIRGYALGGGLELAAACDLRVAAEDARLGQPEVGLGLIPGGGATQRLPRMVGTGQAMRLVLTGDPVDAGEALRIGLVDLVFPAPELRARTLELASRIATRSPVALRLAKEAVRAASEIPMSAGLGREIHLFVASFASADREEGIRAFLEKRRPEFPGR